MATTVLFQTPQGGQQINFNQGNVQLAAIDVSAALNLRIILGAGTRALTYTVKISSAATGQNSNVEAVLDTIAVTANTIITRTYLQPLARRLKVIVGAPSSSASMATCIILGN